MSATIQAKHTISFAGIHKSITSLNSIELPGFVVLTGVNGSGKSHLLEAIQSGKVSSSLISDHASEIKMFTSTTIVPVDSGPFNQTSLRLNRNKWFQQIEALRPRHFENLQKIAVQHGIPGEFCTSIAMLSQLTVEHLNEAMGDIEKANLAHEALQRSIREVGRAIAQNSLRMIPYSSWERVIQKIIENDPGAFFLKNQEDFFRDARFIWTEVDLFQQAFAQVFISYQVAYEKEVVRGKEAPGVYNPSKDFIANYGIPPWDFVNQVLERSNLDFRVNHPEISSDSPYEPKLTKVSKSVGDMLFQDLSSGEKVLMSFALCLYNTQDNRQFKAFPKLLLLDEIDAPLHPSMIKSLIDTIHEVLVEGQKIAVILTTHSPSTVALVSDDSIYAMDPTGPRVKKVTKNNALAILTSGVPTLSIDYSGQRQVFVESQTDAKLLDQIYQQFKGYLNPERSLSFIEVGRINKIGVEQDAGCSQVRRFVSSLHDAGNRTVLGLIDWDGKNNPHDCLHVLCHEIRDGIENVLLDPVLVATTLVRIAPEYSVHIGLMRNSESYYSLLNGNSFRWQEAVDFIQDYVLLQFGPVQGGYKTINYQNGISLNIRTAYLKIDDHTLEDLVRNSFEPLKKEKDLCQYIFMNVLRDSPMLLPTDILNSLNLLLMHEF